MTFYTCLKLCDRFGLDMKTTRVTIEKAADGINGSTAELRAGDSLTLEELFYALILPSGNDAGIQCARYFGSLLLEHGELVQKESEGLKS